jgi:hypothetical protein
MNSAYCITNSESNERKVPNYGFQPTVMSRKIIGYELWVYSESFVRKRNL